VRAGRSNEGPARTGAAQEEGVTTSDQPSGDDAVWRVDEPVDDRRSSVVDNKRCSPWHPISVGCPLIIREPWGLPCLPWHRFSVGWPLIIQTILLYPSGAVWTDEASNMSRRDPSGAVQGDAEHSTRNRKVGSNPTSGPKPQVRARIQ
jgi:hypothetical protein